MKDFKINIEPVAINIVQTPLPVTWMVRGDCVAADHKTLEKTTGTDSWDSDAYSADGYLSNMAASWKTDATNTRIMAGLATNPAFDSRYEAIECAWYLNQGSAHIYESGVTDWYSYGSYTPDTIFRITYDGLTVRYYMDGVLCREVPRQSGSLFYFDSSFFSVGGRLVDVYFSAITRNTTTIVESGPSVSLNDACDNIMNNIYLSLMIAKGSWFQAPDFGSRIHLLKRAKLTAHSEGDLVGYIREALQWIVDIGRIKSQSDISITTERRMVNGTGRLCYTVTVLQANGRPVTYSNFVEVV